MPFPEEPVFAVTIAPHRSLAPHHFRMLMMLLCGLSAFLSLPFLLMGFWPVVGFYGLDLLLLFIAFRASYAQEGAREHLHLTPCELVLAHIPVKGPPRHWQFNPLWTRLHSEIDDDFGVQKLSLVSRGQSVAFAQCLSPPERQSLAQAFEKALAHVKKG